jgi:HPt (histidine-containing phosphotransfer) domain-containing protein
MTDDPGLDAQLDTLREKFRGRLPSYRERLALVRAAFTSSNDNEAVRQIKGLAHELAGASSTFGYTEIGEIAAELEGIADRILEGAEERNAVIAPLRQLVREIEFTL